MLLLLLALAAEPPPPRTIAIVPAILSEGSAKGSLSPIYEAAVRASAMRLGLSVISDEEIFARASGLGEAIVACGSNTGCVATVLRRIDAHLGLVAILNAFASPPIVSLQLLDIDAAREIGESSRQLAAVDAIAPAMEAEAAALLERSGFPKGGRLVILAEPPEAIVKVDGVPMPASSAESLLLAPGLHAIEVSADDHEPAAASVEVVAGAERSTRLTLSRIPGVLESWWFWTLVGVAVAGGTTGAVIASQTPSRCVCFEFRGVGCGACE